MTVAPILHSKVLYLTKTLKHKLIVQFLRLVHSVCDHHPNKYLLLSKRELLELKESKNQNPSIDYILENNLYCQEDEGKISVYVLKGPIII